MTDPGAIERGHRADCGCHYCTTTTLRSVIDRGGDGQRQRLAFRVEEQMQAILRDSEPDTSGWHGGREITQGQDDSIRGCTHRNYTKYGEGRFFCRRCGKWMDKEPTKP